MASEAQKTGLQGDQLPTDLPDERPDDGLPQVRTRSITPLRLEPPPQIRKPKRRPFNSLEFPEVIFGPAHWQHRNICARSQYCPVPSPATPVHTLRAFPEIGSEDAPPSYSFRRHHPSKGYDGNPYVVVGIMGIHHPIARERLLEVTKPETLFRRIRAGSRAVRPLYRRIFSLKHVGGFSMYQCNSVKGYHTIIEIDHQTEVILTELFRDYESGEPDYGDRWLNWIQQEFNMHHENPADGKYALQFVLRWSPPKVVMYGTASIILALIIGFWYMYAQRFPGAGPSDIFAITQTAWTISSFILTAAGGESSRGVRIGTEANLCRNSCDRATCSNHADW
jgi:hypothetical protein